MNDLDLGPALRDRVGEVHPDLDRLAAVSLRAGTRLRRRRTFGVSLAAAAGVAVVAGVVWQLAPGQPEAVDIGYAAQPSASSTPTPEQLEQLVPLECLVSDDATAISPPIAESSPVATYQCHPLITTPPAPQELPVTHDDLPGWTFGTPGDDKFPASKGDYQLSVNVRPLSELSAWSGADGDRPSSQVVHQGKNYFVTVQPGPDVPRSVVDELVAGLHFKPVWHQG
ncbi:hypothetical protein [Nocardioides sp.]|uniref:hypothetical protein n=1 Tax=Nocardioides sp. TaxID=35761 RepID=UPI0039E466EA